MPDWVESLFIFILNGFALLVLISLTCWLARQFLPWVIAGVIVDTKQLLREWEEKEKDGR